MIERILIILLVNLVFFFRTLKLNYSSDDVPVFQNPPKYKNFWHKRYLQLISSARIEARQDHALTTILQAMTAALVYIAFGANDVSFLTAMLFSFCPANNQVSIWISGRWYMLVTMLLLLCMIIPWASPLFIFAASTHPAGFFSSVVFLGSKWWYLALLMPLAVWYRLKTIKFMVTRKRKIEAVKEDEKININRLVVALKTYGFYAFLIIFPWKLTFYHSFMQSMAGNDIMRKRAYKKDHWFYLGLALAGYLIYSISGHWTPISWGVLWYTMAIGPYVNIYRCQQEIAERYCYIGSVGLLYALANIIIACPIVITVFLTMFIVRLWYYMVAYCDDYWLVEKAVMESPGSWYAWHTRARKRFDQGAVREALNMWVMAKLISPKEFKLLVNIGVILKLLNKNQEAEQFFRDAEANVIPGQEATANEILKGAREGKIPIVM